jgi:hypothetical protein
LEILKNLPQFFFPRLIGFSFISKTSHAFSDKGYYHFEDEHTRDLGEMMSIDKDGDRDFDLVPKKVPDFCCKSGNLNFVSDLYMENVGGRYVRRINN